MSTRYQKKRLRQNWLGSGTVGNWLKGPGFETSQWRRKEISIFCSPSHRRRRWLAQSAGYWEVSGSIPATFNLFRENLPFKKLWWKTMDRTKMASAELSGIVRAINKHSMKTSKRSLSPTEDSTWCSSVQPVWQLWQLSNRDSQLEAGDTKASFWYFVSNEETTPGQSYLKNRNMKQIMTSTKE